MALTARELSRILNAPATPINRGTAQAALRRVQAGSTLTDTAQARFLRDYLDGAKDWPTPPVYHHPGHKALMREDGPLTPVELAWLQRLPSDPTKVSYDDAVTLANLARTTTGHEHTADHRLVESYWAPMRHVHDVLEARAGLAAAELPVPALPDSAVTAMTATVRADLGDILTEGEAEARGRDAVNDARTARQANRETRIANGQQRLADLDQAETHRLAPTR